ncbi:peptide ABC transporter substrate-binding protein [Mariniluteicoccus flavus]
MGAVRGWRRASAYALTASLVAGTLAGCAPETVPGPDGTPTPRPSGDIGIQGCQPARSLIPGNTTDACGLRVMEAITARLVRGDTSTGKPVPDLATAIETTDNRTFTVRLAPGRRFHDGTEVKARNVVSAWNWVAYGPNKMAGATFFDPIEGAAAMHCTERCESPRPTEMSGLKVVDDLTFTIRTTRPVTDLTTRLSHPVFAPLPEAFFAEGGAKPEFAARPIGAGPFRFAERADDRLVLERVEDYTGPAPAKVRRATIWFYDQPARGLDAQKAYDDVVANRLDFTGVIPTDMLLDEQWKTDLKDRQSLQETHSPNMLTFMAADRQLADNVLLRQAISRAIDRGTLTRRIFQGTRVPATSWVSPAVNGYATDACGELCRFDLDEAKELYAASGGYTGELDVTVNADGGNKEWADSLCNQLKTNLEIDCQVTVLPNQKAVLDAVEAGRVTGLVRQGWGADYLSPEAYLTIYRRGARANYANYRDQRFEDLMDRAGSAATPEEAQRLYREAEGRLADTPPSLPLWYASTPVGWSTRVTDVRLTPFGTLDLSQVRVR